MIGALALAALVVSPAVAGAQSRSLPPDVDLDPDRGMSFSRLPKTSFDRRVFDPMKQSLTSRAMDPSIDPYNPVVKPSRYEPGSGKIRDSLTDKMRDIKRFEEASRKSRAEAARRNSPEAKTASAAGIVKQRTQSAFRSNTAKKSADD